MAKGDIEIQECYDPLRGRNQEYEAICEHVECDNCEGTGGVFPDYLRGYAVSKLRNEDRPCHRCGGTGLTWEELVANEGV